MKKGLLLTTAIALCLFMSSWALADPYLETLTEDQKVNGFTVKAVYENSADEAMGARFISDDYGFVMDVLRVQSVPQAFFWVKSPVTDSRGEPHACEHLLLGKGNRGRYVATLEDMALGTSTAYTSQVYTAYPFYTTAGDKTFYQLFEAKLDALINPDFSDEEIRREVCHIGLVEDSETGLLGIEEKGTVYTEMISSFERYWYHMWRPMDSMMYGPDHLLASCSGGDPDVMREMVPEHMWDFHKDAYRLGNMGAIVAIADDIPIDKFLADMGAIFSRCQKETTPGHIGTINVQDMPPAEIATPFGTVKIRTYPSENPEDPGYIAFGYPPHLDYDNSEHFVLDLFLETFSGGPGSNLYDLFINSETRKIDLGGNSVWGSSSSDLGHPIYFGLSSINNSYVTEEMIDSVRYLITDAIQEVYDYADGSEELADFNENARSRLIQNAKQFDQYMNSPPGFGFRGGGGGGWYQNMRFLENDPSFRKSLVQKEYFELAGSLLDTEKNFWKRYIDGWQLLTVKPYATAAKPDADMIANARAAKETRIAGYLEDFKKEYGTEDEQEAIAKYKAEFDANTAILNEVASKDELPGFIDNPPLTIDDQLKYEELTLPCGVPMVASTFDNMTSATVGIAMNLDVIPESLLVYVPFLPMAVDAIGVYKDDEVIDFEGMQNRIRREILNLNVYTSFNADRNRRELVVRGAGNSLDELRTAIGWMEAVLYTPYLSTENLPRIKDVITQGQVSRRNRMQGSEESWVNNPPAAYRYQTDPLYMQTQSFLTQIHSTERLRWLMTDPGSATDQKALNKFFTALADEGKGKSRTDLDAFFDAAENGERLTTLVGENASEDAKKLAKDAVMALKATLPEIPDANLSEDWAYLCDRIEKDLMTAPDVSVAAIKHILDLLRKTDNARMFMISSTAVREAALDQINDFADKLDGTTPSVRQQYAADERILKRAMTRHEGSPRPIYVGLLNENTRNGVLLFSARAAGQFDMSEDGLLNCLASKLYGGGGTHGLFMRTWAAGLAYSNGYGFGSQSGFARYYAERCPDVAETMKFVVDVLKNAEENPRLVEYAVAQEFGVSRAASRYEVRGESMAANLTEGVTPEVVASYRKAILAMRDRENLYPELVSRMEGIYGPVLIGYGPSLAESKNGVFFVIGPDSQFESLEKYVETNESKQEICRLYPRDFWLVAN